MTNIQTRATLLLTVMLCYVMLCYVMWQCYQSSADLHPKPFSKQTSDQLPVAYLPNWRKQQLHNPNYYSIPILLTHNTILRQHEHRELNPFLYLFIPLVGLNVWARSW